MNSLINLWKNSLRWRLLVISAFVCTVAYYIFRQPHCPSINDPSCSVSPPPCPDPNNPSCSKTVCPAPTNFAGNYKNGSDESNPTIDLRWNQVSVNIQGFILQRRKNNEKSYQDIAHLSAQTDRYEDKVTFGNDYEYQVITDCGGRNRSTSNLIQIDMTPFYEITELSVNRERDNLLYVLLGWEGKGDLDLTRFSVKRRKNEKNDPQWKEIEKSESLRLYVDRDKFLKPGMEYCYQVVPKLVDGTEGKASNVECYTMPLPAPKNLKVERKSGGIHITWEWPENSLMDVEKFVIERSLFTQDRWEKITTVTPPEKEYMDSKVEEYRTDYHYRAFAVDKQGRNGFLTEIKTISVVP